MPAEHALFSRKRIVMRPQNVALSGLRLLGRYSYKAAQSGLSEHRHQGAVEICYMVRGRQTYRVGGTVYSVRGGEVFVTFPDELHDTGGLPEEKGVLYWMVVAMPASSDSLLGLPTRDSAALARALRQLPRRHFRGTWKMKAHLDDFTRIYHQDRSLLKPCTLANRTIAFLLEVIAAADSPVSSRSSRSLAPVIDYIHSHIGSPLGIPELALRAGLSEARFKVRFKEETGTPPAEYVQRARIEEARRRIDAGNESVTDIAYDLGFSSSQYFATVFRRFTGRSPTGR